MQYRCIDAFFTTLPYYLSNINHVPGLNPGILITMRHAYSTRYLRLVDAQESKTSYDDYLRLGLRCGYNRCPARVFFVAGNNRSEHTRKLKSGIVVPVKQSVITSHFTCFDTKDCARICHRWESLNQAEVKSTVARSKGQRLQHVWIHFLQMIQLGLAPVFQNWEDDNYLRVVDRYISSSEMKIIDELAYKIFTDQLDRFKSDSVLILDKLVMEAQKPGSVSNFMTAYERNDFLARFLEIRDWLVDLEIDLHKAHVLEAFDFLAMRRQRSLFSRVLLRGVYSWVSSQVTYHKYSVSKKVDAFAATQAGVYALVAIVSTTYWAGNWELIERGELVVKSTSRSGCGISAP